MKILTITGIANYPKGETSEIWTSENRFDPSETETDLYSHSSIPIPPGGGGGSTPGDPIIIDTYLPWLIATAVLIIILMKFLKKR